MSKRTIIISVALILLALGYITFTYLWPLSPDLTPIDNPIKDRAVTEWSKLENQVKRKPLKEAYFGDLHVHTKYSFDAFIGGVSAGPDEAYQFAKGSAIDVLDKQVKIERPLDFAAVTDHAEYIGEMYSVQHSGTPGYSSIPARLLRSIGKDTLKQAAFFARMSGAANKDQNKIRTHPDFFRGFSTTISAWDQELAAAEKHYVPGKFTTFAAYEWSLGMAGVHMHRNLIFRDMKVPDYPLSAFEAKDEEALWSAMEDYRSNGSTVMAIPHNSNLSNGMIFPESKVDGSDIDAAYVQTRKKNEPLVEIHQAKGNSEVHPQLWANDEHADFEIYYARSNPNPNSFVRHVLKRGLKYKSELGTNPYEYGLIGSTDTHNGTPGNTEENDDYQGNHLSRDTHLARRLNSNWILNPELKTYNAINPGGLVGVWSEANTRPDIYDALKRKETFATSGGRITVRFFAGSDYNSEYEDHDAMVRDGYNHGVSMGDIINIENDDKPEFLLWAAKDPIGANLEKIQIIKGWYQNGQLKEQIIDAVVTDHPTTDDQNVVDISTGAVDPSYGQSSLFTKWIDESFDPDVPAFYYLRVIEVPTPRYTQWDEIKHGVKYPEDMTSTIRERAWSSPIWYYPK